MSKIELLPCPFCGRIPELQDHRTIWGVHCECGACVLGERAPEPDGSEPNEYWEMYEETAISRWNTRSEIKAMQDKLEVAKEVLDVLIDDGCYGGYVLGEDLWEKFQTVFADVMPLPKPPANT